MIDLFLEKLTLSAVLLVVTILCSVAPWLLKSGLGKNFTIVLKYLNTLAGGVVMGALLLHMIPELFHSGHQDDHHHHSDHHTSNSNHSDHHTSNSNHSDHHTSNSNHSHKHHKHDHHHKQSFITFNEHYSWGCFAAGVSFLFLFYVDRIFFGHHHDDHVVHHSDHEHQDKDEPCCNGHQGHGTMLKKSSTDYKQLAIQLSTSSSNQVISIEKAKEHSNSNSNNNNSNHHHTHCHSHDLVGGCHMDSITSSTSQTQTMIFVLALSMHSFMEGLGAAGQSDTRGLTQFALSLVGHKLLEAFALGVSVMRADFSTIRTTTIISVYSLLTPAGILSGMGALHAVGTDKWGVKIAKEILNGAAVGSFLFVGMIEMIPPEFHKFDQHSKGKFAMLCIGFLLMAGVNVIGHEHH